MSGKLTSVAFRDALHAEGMRLLVPGVDEVPTWGLVDVGGKVVSRWDGGSTLDHQLLYLRQAKAAVMASRGKPAAKRRPHIRAGGKEKSSGKRKPAKATAVQKGKPRKAANRNGKKASDATHSGRTRRGGKD